MRQGACVVLSGRGDTPLHGRPGGFFGEARIPAGSMIALTREGKPDFVQLSRDTMIAGSNCGGGGWLGVDEGLTTSFYPSGKLKQCFLASDQTAQGVPCMNGGFFGDGRAGAPSSTKTASSHPAS